MTDFSTCHLSIVIIKYVINLSFPLFFLLFLLESFLLLWFCSANYVWMMSFFFFSNAWMMVD